MSQATQLKPARMNLRAAARYLGVGTRKLQMLVSSGRVKYVTDPGGIRMYPTVWLDEFVEAQMREAETR